MIISAIERPIFYPNPDGTRKHVLLF